MSGARNQFAFILIDASTGERTIIWDRDQRLVMLPADVSRELVSSAKVLLVDGHDAGAAVQAARFAREAGSVVVMDAERISDETPELVSLVDVIIGERSFPERFTGLTDIKEALVSLAGKGPRLAGVTLGKKGALVFCNGAFSIPLPMKCAAVILPGQGMCFTLRLLERSLRIGILCGVSIFQMQSPP